MASNIRLFQPSSRKERNTKAKFTKSLAVLDILRKAEEAEENFDIPGRIKCVLKLTLHAAANTQPSQNKKGSTADGWNLLYQSFNEILLPEEAANRASDMELPGVLDINGAYYIKIDNSAVALTETKSFEQSLGYLLMYYHILDINYPSKLKFVYGFLETMFEMVPSMNPSKKIKDLCSFVFN
ncbi:hypothetical protein DAPPUDRAFT_115296 [Daphnia pulex]|uniref:Uncharacterized protein n=1 Tax=Daphnia pulex TaxID=6669 RepID=E9HKW9_DAPPU|nr:hypothetical protein DAPPUDRAFT_115296 [Daphnia pulex]|eukprot:EFX67622.1 hypothetical protein DAPPUDRAFT_115296 [Daphnia pulex]